MQFCVVGLCADGMCAVVVVMALQLSCEELEAARLQS